MNGSWDGETRFKKCFWNNCLLSSALGNRLWDRELYLGDLFGYAFGNNLLTEWKKQDWVEGGLKPWYSSNRGPIQYWQKCWAWYDLWEMC